MKKLRRYWLCLASCLGGGAILAFVAFSVLADAPPPALKISPSGTNQISVTITNSVSTTNYTLFWTPVLGDAVDYPWEAIEVGSIGQSNFTFDISSSSVGFFRAALLASDGVPPWEAADPNNPNSPILTVSIISPADGSTVQ